MNKKEKRGRLIAFAGLEGAGKTTQMARLQEHLVNEGIKTLVVKELANMEAED